MGRHKKVKTRSEILAQKAKYREAHNRRRRIKYMTDDRYRKATADTNRDRYRDDHGVEVRVAPAPTSEGLPCAKRKVVMEDGSTKTVLCMDYAEMAEALGGYHKFVIHRWHRSGRFPRAKNYTIETVRKAVYLMDEARKLISIMREHQKTKLYLTIKDQSTIERLFGVMG